MGVAFVSKLAVQKELAAGQLHALTVKGIPLRRSLRCVADPARYQSRAVRAFIDLMFDPSADTTAEVPTPLEEEVCILLLPRLLCKHQAFIPSEHFWSTRLVIKLHFCWYASYLKTTF